MPLCGYMGENESSLDALQPHGREVREEKKELKRLSKDHILYTQRCSNNPAVLLPITCTPFILVRTAVFEQCGPIGYYNGGGCTQWTMKAKIRRKMNRNTDNAECLRFAGTCIPRIAARDFK